MQDTAENNGKLCNASRQVFKCWTTLNLTLQLHAT